MSIFSTALLLGSLASAASPGIAVESFASSKAGPSRYVVVLGYNGPADGERPRLQWADDDAIRLYLQLLPGAKRAWLLTGFDSASARLWTREGIKAHEPTRAELARVLGEAYWQMRSEAGETELVFAVVGHGDVDAAGEGYVVLADGNFSRTDLERQVVEASPATVNHVVVDTCASYHLVSRGDAVEAIAPSLQDALRAPTSSSGAVSAGWERTGVLVATSSAAATHESAGMGGGVFSFVLRSALTGAADVNGDGRVEYGEVSAFVAAANAAVVDPRARLDVTVRPPSHEPHVAVVDLARSGYEHFLVVDGDSEKRVRLLDARGLPWAEVHRERGMRTMVGLVGSPYFVVETNAQQAVVVPRQAGAYALSSLRFTDSPTSRGVDDPVAQSFFSIPYGRAFLQGFLADSSAVPPHDGDRFDVAFAVDGEPPFRWPLTQLATGSLLTAGVLAVGAAGAAVGNSITLGELDGRFRQTGTLDPELSLRADSFLTVFAVLGAGAVAASVAGAALGVASLEEEP